MTFVPLSEGSTKCVHFLVYELTLALMLVSSSLLSPAVHRSDPVPVNPYGIYDNVPLASTQHQYPTPGTSRKLFSGVFLM